MGGGDLDPDHTVNSSSEDIDHRLYYDSDGVAHIFRFRILRRDKLDKVVLLYWNHNGMEELGRQRTITTSKP